MRKDRTFALSPLRLSVIGDRERPISDRVSFIMVRDGIDMKALEAAIDLDDRFPYYAQPHKTEVRILRDVADFLGVSFEWLVTGQGSPSKKDERSSQTFTGSAVVSGNAAHSIHVHNYGPKEGAIR